MSLYCLTDGDMEYLNYTEAVETIHSDGLIVNGIVLSGPYHSNKPGDMEHSFVTIFHSLWTGTYRQCQQQLRELKDEACGGEDLKPEKVVDFQRRVLLRHLSKPEQEQERIWNNCFDSRGYYE